MVLQPAHIIENVRQTLALPYNSRRRLELCVVAQGGRVATSTLAGLFAPITPTRMRQRVLTRIGIDTGELGP